MRNIIPALLSTTICLTLAAESTGRIVGKVTSMAGKPIPGASITLKRLDISWTKVLKANSNGLYQQAGLDPREFDATVTAEGFVPQVARIKIPLGESLTKDFQLLTPQEALASAPKTTVADPSAEKSLAGTQAFNQAVAFYNDKNYLEALPLTELAYKNLKESYELLPAEGKPTLAPQLTQVERVHGVVLFEVGKEDEARQKELWAKAEPLLSAAFEKNPKDQRALDSLITISKAKGDAEATKKYESAMDVLIGPRPDLAYNQGVDLYNKGNMAGAKPFFQKTLQVDPTFAEAYYLLAMCDFAENNLKATKVHLQKYIEVAPKGKHAEEVKAMLDDPSLKRIK